MGGLGADNGEHLRTLEDTKVDQAQRRTKGIVPELDISFSLGLRLRSQVHAIFKLSANLVFAFELPIMSRSSPLEECDKFDA
ncbi:hypothetical protein GQ457_09G015540 [Hibiscus cannabinus]